MNTNEKYLVGSLNKEKSLEEIFDFFSPKLKKILVSVDNAEMRRMEEIRLRADRPLVIQNSCGEWFVMSDGQLSRKNGGSFTVRQEEVVKTLELMSENSIYAYQEEIRSGFITLRGGHRVGIVGKVVMDGKDIKNIKDISGLNVRIAKEVKGCCSRILKYLISDGRQIFNTLIVSPPQCGKTTLLRDIARSISDGVEELFFGGVKVGIVDERSEIAACYRGIAQNDIGIRTDVLDGCPKSLGMDMMLRSMSPNVIVTDEIGNTGDMDAVMRVLNAGICIVTTAHGYGISDLKCRQEVLSMIDAGVFERFVVLSNKQGTGTVEEIVDGLSMKRIYG